MKIIKIFLASSETMADCRKQFEIDISRLNNEWVKRDLFLDLEIWEEFNEYMVKEGKQQEYNQAVEACDIFVLLFADFVGRYSKEEFNHAYQRFSKSDDQLPKIFTYFIEPTKGIKDKTTEDFLKELDGLKHYPGKYESFDAVRTKFQTDLRSLIEKDLYFSFPDLTPRVNEKVQYIKMLHLTDKQKNAEPVYRKYIERLKQEEDVYDEAQFFELHVYSGAGRSTLANNYSLSSATIDMNVIIPRQDPSGNKRPGREDDRIKHSVKRNFNLASPVFYSATSFINGFQRDNTFYQTRADEYIKALRLIIDFSALPHHRKIQRSAPTAELYNASDETETKALTVSEIKAGVYQAEAADLKADDIVVMRFDINWDEI